MLRHRDGHSSLPSSKLIGSVGGDTLDDGVEDVKAIKHSLLTLMVKRAIDITAALVFFSLFGVVYLFLWAGVLISSGRPALYTQQRFGKDGKVFRFYKFRSMIANSDNVLEEYLKNSPAAQKQWNEFQKLERDPRITKFGAFIRKTSMDEFPQFWNVLVGNMSLVGPRPCMTSQKHLYGNFWHYYCAVRPGITGLWQVSGRNKLAYNQRVALDVQYVSRLSVFRDLIIILRTLYVVASGHGSR